MGGNAPLIGLASLGQVSSIEDSYCRWFRDSTSDNTRSLAQGPASPSGDEVVPWLTRLLPTLGDSFSTL